MARWQRPKDWPRNAVCLLHVDGHAIFVSVHAARRWAQRVRCDPRRQLKELRPDIERIARACGEVKSCPPPWSNPALDEDGDAEVAAAEMWLMFGPDIAMPVRGGIAVTTLDRGSLAPEARAFRRDRRQRAAYARLAKAQERGVPSRAPGDKWRVRRRRAADG